MESAPIDASESGDDALEIYWATGPCPTGTHRDATGDLRAIRISDVIDRRAYHELPIYREYFEPGGVEHVADLGLPTEPGRHRGFIFFRGTGLRDFSQRDLDVLEMLRPHLSRMEEHAALRRRLQDLLREREEDQHDERAYATLTLREREVVELVAQGRTNAEIAAALWVAPSTVKKHLENVYAKIGIGRRAAAAAAARYMH
jgi:DNA-binding CsgD family transcriptional regulator